MHSQNSRVFKTCTNPARNNVALQVELQVEMVCCAYYHLLAKQIFKSHKVTATSTFCNIKVCCARRW